MPSRAIWARPNMSWMLAITFGGRGKSWHARLRPRQRWVGRDTALNPEEVGLVSSVPLPPRRYLMCSGERVTTRGTYPTHRVALQKSTHREVDFAAVHEGAITAANRLQLKIRCVS